MSNELITALQSAAGNAGGGFYPYTIDNSARFNDNDSPKLLRTQTAGNRKIATFSFWVKRSTLGSNQHIITGGYDDGTAVSDSAPLRFRSDDKIEFLEYINGYIFHVISNAVFRDTSAWYHFVWVMDTTQATSSNRIKLYVNGIQQSFSSASYPSQNYDTNYNASGEQTQIGYQGQTPSSNDRSYFDGYMAEFHYIDGTAYDASAFGEDKNGVWIPKSPSVTYGTNGFYLDFLNSGALGTDVSGNGNNFTVSGLTSSDQMIDTPTSNFCTLNPLDGAATAEGNLQQSARSSSWATCQSTMALPKTGKWYWEAVVSGSGDGDVGSMGISADPASSYVGSTTNGYGYLGANGYIYELGTATPYGATYGAGDIIGILWDADNGDLTFYKNGTSQGVAKSGLDTSIGYRPAVSQYNSYVTNVNFGQNGTFNGAITAGGNSDANGIGDFKYTVPTDALALCTANLPEPTIGPNSTTTSDENFNTVLYTGNGTSQNVTGFGFDPDMVWHKGRSLAQTHSIVDVVRGNSQTIFTNLTAAEQNPGAQLDLITDGATVTYRGANLANNTSGGTYVIWGWKANGSGVSNTDGSITSTVSANTDAGISIATFTMPSSGNFTVGHGLGVAPKMFILKRTSNTSSWGVWHEGLTGGTYYLLLDGAGAQVNDSTVWTSAPTSTLLNIGSAWPSAGQDAVAYAFAEVEGFSSFGSYTGNGSADGPFIYTGFRPAWFMLKKSSGTGWWYIFDSERNTYNLTGKAVFPNSTSAESDYPGGSSLGMDFLSNGVKLRGYQTEQNGSGTSYIYMAFAEMPFKYSRGR